MISMKHIFGLLVALCVTSWCNTARAVRGVVLQLGKDFGEIRVEGKRITAQAGATLGALSRAALENGLEGLEFAEGIPGSVGGGVYMNAGAYGGEMAQVLVSVRVLKKDGAIEEMSIEEHMDYYLKQGIAKKEAMKMVAKDRGIGKRDVYRQLL